MLVKAYRMILMILGRSRNFQTTSSLKLNQFQLDFICSLLTMGENLFKWFRSHNQDSRLANVIKKLKNLL